MRVYYKFRQYYKLSKFNLTFLVVFSSIMSYLLVENVLVAADRILWLALGGFCITASANTFNQLLEKDTDAMMNRTKSRPIASGVMGETEGIYTAVGFLIIGTFVMAYFFNWSATILAWVSLVVYAWVYTPMKKMTPFSVIVGAVPGALPCLIGWLAGGGEFWSGGLVLFALQFVWQFPHFWAIAWLSHKDYEKAGLRLLPSVAGPSKYVAAQSILYSLLLIPIGFLPFFIGMAGFASALIIFIANVMLLVLCLRLYYKMTDKAARYVMFGSYLHLPILFFSLFLDKLY